MTFLEMRQRIQVLCKIGGWDNVDPPPDYAFLANEGLRLFSWEVQSNSQSTTVTTVVDQSEYDLSTTNGDWINISDVSYGTDTAIYPSNESIMRRMDPLWFQSESSTPQWWWIHDANVLKLWPPPDTASITIYVQGTQCDPTLSADTDTPSAPKVFHEGMCLFGAWFHGKSYCLGEEKSRAVAYRKEALDYASKCTQYFAAQDTPSFQRRVARPAFQRTYV